MILLGFVVLITLAANTDASEQITLFNVNRLANAIQNVCVTGQPEEIRNFKLPQDNVNVGVQAALIINKNTDPDYLVYYEKYPTTKNFAVEWEVYLEDKLPDNIVFVQGDLEGMNLNDLKSKKIEIKSTLESMGIEDPQIIFNQILLTDEIDPITLEKLDKESSVVLNPIGKWDEDRTKFLLNRTPKDRLYNISAKYFPCGENTLCFKTPTSIRPIELKGCEGLVDIKYKLPFFKRQDFNIRSPCDTSRVDVEKEFKIEKNNNQNSQEKFYANNYEYKNDFLESTKSDTSYRKYDIDFNFYYKSLLKRDVGSTRIM